MPLLHGSGPEKSYWTSEWVRLLWNTKKIICMSVNGQLKPTRVEVLIVQDTSSNLLIVIAGKDRIMTNCFQFHH